MIKWFFPFFYLSFSSPIHLLSFLVLRIEPKDHLPLSCVPVLLAGMTHMHHTPGSEMLFIHLVTWSCELFSLLSFSVVVGMGHALICLAYMKAWVHHQYWILFSWYDNFFVFICWTILHYRDKTHLTQCVILFIFEFIFISILLSICGIIFIRYISLQFPFLMMPLSGFAISLTLPWQNEFFPFLHFGGTSTELV